MVGIIAVYLAEGLLIVLGGDLMLKSFDILERTLGQARSYLDCWVAN